MEVILNGPRMTKMDFPSKAAFRGYLENHLYEDVGYGCSVKYCPIANFLTSLGFTSPKVTVEQAYANDGENQLVFSLPEWAQNFIMRFDATAGTYERTGRQALAVLARG